MYILDNVYARTSTQLLYKLAVKSTLWCTAVSNSAYVQFEVCTHCSAVIFHSVLRHIRTFHASWCSCPPLSQNIGGGGREGRVSWDGGCVGCCCLIPMDHSTVAIPMTTSYWYLRVLPVLHTHKGQLGRSERGPLNLLKSLHEHQLD